MGKFAEHMAHCLGDNPCHLGRASHPVSLTPYCSRALSQYVAESAIHPPRVAAAKASITSLFQRVTRREPPRAGNQLPRPIGSHPPHREAAAVTLGWCGSACILAEHRPSGAEPEAGECQVHRHIPGEEARPWLQRTGRTHSAWRHQCQVSGGSHHRP